ncbi:MAG: PilT/PilU family type 4a pilus ATPase [Deltaproteobacteria bacterium]|nr:PilT/PilU family type 4a pilus ATPase [Deltaproteobacteria bacterium]
MRRQEIDHIMTRMLDSFKRVSDLNVTVGRPFQVETDGILKPVDMEPPVHELTPFQTELVALNLINRDRRLTQTLVSQGSCDMSYHLPGKARFRVNIFYQRGNLSVVCRKLEPKIPTIKELELPEALHRVSEEMNGLVLVTGATGVGKSTTLAAVLNEINEKRPVHIVTLEDPVEFQHPHKVSTFNQRELGTDFDEYAHGLRAALRQAPKVILVGEMRDRETVEIALTAAETGHLVLTTLHTVDAGHTINRLLGMVSTEEENQIRIRLADTLRWVVCQRLLPKVGGDRVAAFEIMSTSLRVKDAILHGEAEGKTFYEIIEAGTAFGNMTFDQSLVSLYERGLITEQAAMAYSTHRGSVGRGIDRIKSMRGEKTSDIDKLEVDAGYARRLRE